MSQVASGVILIRPTGFGFDPETAESNGFLQLVDDPETRKQAEEEFDALLMALRNCGIATTVLDPVDPAAPNAVFPNNWFSTHADGTVVLYPMCTPSRRAERDRAFDEVLVREGFKVRRLVDLSVLEDDDRFLEGTGSMILDRPNKIVYACLSPRTDKELLQEYCSIIGYEMMAFTALDGQGQEQSGLRGDIV